MNKGNAFKETYQSFKSNNHLYDFESDLGEGISINIDQISEQMNILRSYNVISSATNIKQIFLTLIFRDLLLFGSGEKVAITQVNSIVNGEYDLFAYYYMISRIKKEEVYIIIYDHYIDVVTNTEYQENGLYDDKDIRLKLSFRNYINLIFQRNVIKDSSNHLLSYEKQLAKAFKVIEELNIKNYSLRNEKGSLIVMCERGSSDSSECKKWQENKYFMYGEITKIFSNGTNTHIKQKFKIKIDEKGNII